MDPDTIESLVIDSEISTIKSVSELQFEKRIFRNVMINTGIIYAHEQGKSDHYENFVNRNQLGLFALWSQNFPKVQWKMNINLRQDFVENYLVPFTPSIGLEGKIYKIVSAKINVSRNFRVPTFNDKYWVPGGNVNLKPESSWNEEVSLIFDMYLEKFRNKTGMIFTLYNSNVDDWILWKPEGLYWSAQNIQKVWSRGFEAEYKSTFSIQPVEIQFIGGYTYARSTNEKKLSENDQTYQKQLMYIPETRYFFTGTLGFMGFMVSYNQSFTGERYVTRDNKEQLPAYSLGNISLLKKIALGNQFLDFSFEINNVWDVNYQAVQYNQMPGRNYKISLTININRKQNEKNEN